jgi:ribosomal protein L16 Arg81 hydroxylase
MIGNLAALLAPVSEQTFLDHFLGKERLHVKAGQPRRAEDLLAWETINQLIQSDLLPPERFRVVRANVDMLPTMFRNADATRSLRAGALQNLLSQGVSMIVNGIGDYVPQIGRLSDAIERRLGHQAWVNAYFSFGRGGALKAHWDEHDVLVVQVHGSKHWHSYGTPVPYPLSAHNAGKDLGSKIVWEGTLEAGDVLYLPRGEVHEAAVDNANSVHLTIGLQTLCGIDFLGWIAKKAAAELVLRKDVSRVGGSEALRLHEQELKARLHAIIDATSVESYLQAEDTKRKPRPLLSLGLENTLNDSTVIVPAPRRRVPLPSPGANDAEATVGDETYLLSAAALQVLAYLIEHNGTQLRALKVAFAGTIEPAALHDAVRELARKGLVGPASSASNP